jgi:carboxypeptidase C (cathepsin A)
MKIFFLIIFFFLYTNSKFNDEVFSLPFLERKYEKQFAGHMPIFNKKSKLFYWFFEQYSETINFDKNSIPIILWLNGGPGSSSLIGNFIELGLKFNLKL